MEVKAAAPENAYSPMLVTPFGMLISVKLDAPWNALAPMLVMFAEMITEDIFRFLNASSPMLL